MLGPLTQPSAGPIPPKPSQQSIRLRGRVYRGAWQRGCCRRRRGRTATAEEEEERAALLTGSEGKAQRSQQGEEPWVEGVGVGRLRGGRRWQRRGKARPQWRRSLCRATPRPRRHGTSMVDEQRRERERRRQRFLAREEIGRERWRRRRRPTMLSNRGRAGEVDGAGGVRRRWADENGKKELGRWVGGAKVDGARTDGEQRKEKKESRGARVTVVSRIPGVQRWPTATASAAAKGRQREIGAGGEGKGRGRALMERKRKRAG